MQIKLGSCELEVTRNSLSIALPGIGQAFIGGNGLSRFDSWKAIQQATAAAEA